MLGDGNTADRTADGSSCLVYGAGMAIEPSAARLQEAMERLGEAVPDRREDLSALPPPIVIGERIRSIAGVANALTRDLVVFNASARRIAWALLRVAELVLADMDRRRMVEDDRPALALAMWRRCCLDAPGASMLDVTNSLDEAVKAAAGRESWIEANGYQTLSDIAYAARSMIYKRGSAEAFVRASNKAAKALQREDEPAEAAKAQVFTVLVEALAEVG
jgi:hypothetical protein